MQNFFPLWTRHYQGRARNLDHRRSKVSAWREIQNVVGVNDSFVEWVARSAAKAVLIANKGQAFRVTQMRRIRAWMPVCFALFSAAGKIWIIVRTWGVNYPNFHRFVLVNFLLGYYYKNMSNIVKVNEGCGELFVKSNYGEKLNR